VLQLRAEGVLTETLRFSVQGATTAASVAQGAD